MEDGALEFVARLQDQASDEVKRVRRVMENLGGPVDPVDADVVMQAEGTAQVVSDVEGAGDRAEAAAKAAGEDAGDGFVDMFKASFAGNLLAGIVEGAAAGAADAFGQAWDQAIGGELSLDVVSAQLGATAEQSRVYGEVAGSLYADAYGESLEEVQGAVGAVVSSVEGMRDASAEVLQQATRDVLNYASTFEVDVGRATQVAGQLVRTGLASDFDEAMALMTASSQQVPAAIREDLLDAADEYGPFFAQLGMDGEQAFAALVAGAEQGMYGIDKTGDALKEFTVNAADMARVGPVFEGLGLDAQDMQAAILAGGDEAGAAMQQIVEGLLGMEDPGEQAAAAIALFGAPLEDLGTGQIPDFLASLATMDGGVGDLTTTMSDLDAQLNGNTATAVEQMKRELSGMASDVLAKVLPPLLSLLSWALETPGAIEAVGAVMVVAAGLMSASAIAAGAKATAALFKIGAEWVTAGAKATASAAKQGAAWVATGARAVAGAAVATAQAARVAAAWVMMQARAMANAARMAVAWAVGVIAPAAAATAAMAAQVARQVAAWVLLGVQSLIQAARVAAAWLIAMGPIGLVIAAVIGLVALIVANWDKIVAVTRKVWAAVSKWVVDKAKAIRDGVVGWITRTRDDIRNRIETIKANVRAIIGAVRAYIVGQFRSARDSVTGTVGGIRDRIRDGFQKAYESVKTWLLNAVDYVKNFPSRAKAALGNLTTTLWSAGGDMVRGFINGVKEKASSLATAALDVVRGAVSAVTGFLGIRSPSRLAAELGGYFGEGLGIGLSREEARVGAKAQALARAMVDPLDQASRVTATLGGPGGATLSVAGRVQQQQTVTIVHEVKFSGPGAERLDAEEVARIIAGNARAAATIEKASRGAARQRDARLVVGR